MAGEKKRASSSRAMVALLGISAIGGLVFVGALGFAAYKFNELDAGEVTEDSFLKVNIGLLSDVPAQPGLFDEPGEGPPTTTEVAEVIRAAGTDERIDGLYLNVNGAAGGWASYQEVRDAIVDFQAGGKPCVAYAEGYGNGSYYLASACDKILVAPSGASMVIGLASSTTYYKGMFDKLGVEAVFEHVGDFKSGPEPYTNEGPSESAMEAMNVLLDDMYGQMVAGIATGRDVEQDVVRGWIDMPALSPSDAIERGMFDGVAFPDELAARIHKASDEDFLTSLSEPVTEELREAAKDRFTSFGDYRKTVRALNQAKATQVAVVQVEGTIVSGGSGSGGLFGDSGMLTDGGFRKTFREAVRDDAVKAIVLRVNSPGGSGLASDMMWREVIRAKQQGKPVVISMGDLAASGGYFISAPGDYIFAQPGTITGSIGVFGGKFNLAGLYEKAGMTSHLYKRGENSDMFSSNSNFSESGRESYVRFMEEFYDVFLTKVADGRSMDKEAVHAVAQGRVWTGTQALERNLVDELGGLDDAIAKAAELAEVSDYGITRLPRQRTLFEQIVEDMQNASAPSISVEVDLGLPGSTQAIEDLMVLEQVLETGPAFILPGKIDIQ